MNEIHPGIIFYDDEILNPLEYQTSRGNIIALNTADLHFSAFDPKEQFDILLDQQIKYAYQLPKLDLFTINGDIFHHKVTTTSLGATYAGIYMEAVVRLCKAKNATLLIIHGTYKHDSNQLNLFIQYLNDPEIDIRIVNEIRFELIKGARCLCIPELYGVDDEVYDMYLNQSGIYDMCFMHGTIKGAIYGDNVGAGKLFTINDFDKCRGPIISGHVHTSSCFNKYFYYCGSPYRWQHGEEEPKGFLMSIMDLDTGSHLVEFIEVKCPKYITIDFDELVNADPKYLINQINKIKVEEGIDFIRVRFNDTLEGSSRTIINNYYRNNKEVQVEYTDQSTNLLKTQKEEDKQDDEYSFLLDNKLSDEEKFVQYVNLKKGYKFITVEKLLNILKEDI